MLHFASIKIIHINLKINITLLQMKIFLQVIFKQLAKVNLLLSISIT
jgi:hypothetical protein